MTWFLYALICLFGWGCADLFYKKGTDEDDKQSHLKIAIWVGLIMGIVSLCLIPFAETTFSFKTFFVSAAKYLPASLGYIISMVIGYAGLRYLEMSIVSPVQNASGALSAIAMVSYFLIIGRIDSITDAYGALDLAGTILIILGVIALAVVEQQLSKKEIQINEENRKYKYGALALLFPILYCLFDTIGTAADGIILDEESGLGIGEIDVLILYGLTFFVAGIGCFIFMWIKNKKPYNPFKKTEWPKLVASICEQFGQVFYVFAMASNPVLAAPLISAYCIVSILLSRVILKEKLKVSQYLCVALVVIGIIILGVSEGLSEA